MSKPYYYKINYLQNLSEFWLSETTCSAVATTKQLLNGTFKVGKPSSSTGVINLEFTRLPTLLTRTQDLLRKKTFLTEAASSVMSYILD